MYILYIYIYTIYIYIYYKYTYLRLWWYVLCRWMISVPSSDPQISLRLRDHFRHCPGNVSEATQLAGGKRNGDVFFSKPRNLLVCCFKHEIHLGYFGNFWDVMMTYDHFRFDGSKFDVIRRMPPFCHRIKGHDFGGVKQLNCQSCI